MSMFFVREVRFLVLDEVDRMMELGRPAVLRGGNFSSNFCVGTVLKCII